MVFTTNAPVLGDRFLKVRLRLLDFALRLEKPSQVVDPRQNIRIILPQGAPALLVRVAPKRLRLGQLALGNVQETQTSSFE